MTPRENAYIAYQHGTPEWVPSRLLDFNITFPAPYIERYQGEESGTDGFGVHWTYEPLIGAPMPTLGAALFDDICDWREKVVFPDLDALNWEAQRALDTKHFVPGRINMAMSINGMFERMHACMGMENALCALVTDPEACYEFAGAVADHKIAMMRKLKQYNYGIDIFDMNDDYGMQGRMIMSLDQWREIYKPHLKRIVDAAHDCGFLYQHHSCGFIEPIIPELVEIGVDALDVLQTCNTNMRTLKDQYQHVLTFCGGFDNQGVFDRPNVTDRECYDETIRAVKEMAPGGSYVAFTVTVSSRFSQPFISAMQDVGREVYSKR